MTEYLDQLSDTLAALRSIPTFLIAITVLLVIIGITIGVLGAIAIGHLRVIRAKLETTPPSLQSAYGTSFPPQQPYGPNNPYGRP